MSRLPMTVGAPYRGQGYGYRGRSITNPWEQAALANALTNQQVGAQDAMTAQPVAFGGLRDVQRGGQISPDSPLTRLAVKTADGRYYMAPPPVAAPQPAIQSVPDDRGASFERIAGVSKDNTNYQAATSWGKQASPEARRYLDMVGKRREAEAARVAKRRADFVARMGYDPVLDRAKAKQALGNSRYTGLDPGLGYMLQGGGAPGGMGRAVDALALGGNPAALELSRQRSFVESAGLNALGRAVGRGGAGGPLEGLPLGVQLRIDALRTAREKGEISQEQYDQELTKLGVAGPGGYSATTPPPAAAQDQTWSDWLSGLATPPESPPALVGPPAGMVRPGIIGPSLPPSEGTTGGFGDWLNGVGAWVDQRLFPTRRAPPLVRPSRSVMDRQRTAARS